MNKLISKVSCLMDMPLPQRVRAVCHFNPPQDFKPLSKHHVVSDMFVFRCDEQWSTEFSVFNFPSYIYPEEMCSERCHLVFYDNNGSEISREIVELEPLEMKKIQVADYLPASVKFGSFAAFHETALIDRVKKSKSYITERGYIGYKKGDGLYSYCHGNMKALSKSLRSDKVRSVVGRSRKHIRYRPQLLLSDSDFLEFIYVNPSASSELLVLKFFDQQGGIIEETSVSIPKFGVYLHKVENSQRLIHTVENWGRIALWRPVIFKYYKTHFDVLHG